MKKILYLFAGIALFASCKSSSNSAATDTTKSAAPLLYKASYSSSWAISDSSKYLQMVLQSYKDWENNNLKNASTYFADTVSADFSDGLRIKMARDSFVKFSQKVRDSLSSSKIDMISIINLYSPDEKANWVALWYKQTDTYKTGKVDSAFFNDVNHIKDGKIDYWSSLRQALKKK